MMDMEQICLKQRYSPTLGNAACMSTCDTWNGLTDLFRLQTLTLGAYMNAACAPHQACKLEYWPIKLSGQCLQIEFGSTFWKRMAILAFLITMRKFIFFWNLPICSGHSWRISPILTLWSGGSNHIRNPWYWSWKRCPGDRTPKEKHGIPTLYSLYPSWTTRHSVARTWTHGPTLVEASTNFNKFWSWRTTRPRNRRPTINLSNTMQLQKEGFRNSLTFSIWIMYQCIVYCKNDTCIKSHPTPVVNCCWH